MNRNRAVSASCLLVMMVLIVGVLTSALLMGLDSWALAAELLQPAADSYPSSPASSMLRMNLKSYGDHNPTYDARILAIKPELVIDNSPHGLYGEMEEEQYPGQGYTASWLLQNVAGYQAEA
jgi:hypothetical protein